MSLKKRGEKGFVCRFFTICNCAASFFCAFFYKRGARGPALQEPETCLAYRKNIHN